MLKLKIEHKSKAATLATGLVQTARYADQCGADSAHLLIFDRDPGGDWDDKFTWRRTPGTSGAPAFGGSENPDLIAQSREHPVKAATILIAFCALPDWARRLFGYLGVTLNP